MPDHKVEGITPIIGANIKIERLGRTLLDISHIELGSPGVTSIIGHNGAGKSLLLKVLTGLVAPDRGVVTWNGRKPTKDDYHLLGYMKQNAVLLRRSAKANLEYPLLIRGMSKAEASLKADEALKEMGLEKISDSSARVLSGGERQRLSLARMLIGDPKIIILDEPTASLDPVSRASIETVVLALKKQHKPVILVTHDLGQAKRLSERIVFIDNGNILELSSSKDFFAKPANRIAQDFLQN